MGQQSVGSGTGSINQLGNVGGGQNGGNGVGSGGYSGGDTNITQSNSAQNSAQIAGGSSFTALTIGSSNQGAITLNQESPQAIAALAAGTQAALFAMNSTALGSLGIAHSVADDALDIAKNATQSQTQQFGQILIPLGIAAAIVFGIYFYKRG